MGPIILIIAIFIVLYCVYLNNQTSKEQPFEPNKKNGLETTKTEPVEEHFENTLSNEDFVKKEEKVVKKPKRKYSKNTPRKKENTIEKIVESK